MQGQPRTQPAQMKRQATLIDSPTSCRSTVIDDSNESDSPTSCRSTVIDISNESDAAAVDETLVMFKPSVESYQESRCLINTNNYAGLSERTVDNVPAHGAERRLQYQLIIGKKLPTDEIRCCMNPERRCKFICPRI